MNYRKFMKNAKAISPIFATLILIAIAVIAGVVVYMFTSGTLATMTAGGTAGTEKVAVQGVTLSVANGLTIYAQSTNNVNVTINSAVIKNPNGDIVWATPSTWAGATLLSTGALTTMGPITGLTGVSAGNAYTVTIVSSKGGSFVASGVIAGV
jgi:archaeal type IV pilus assembly protein PilA